MFQGLEKLQLINRELLLACILTVLALAQAESRAMTRHSRSTVFVIYVSNYFCRCFIQEEKLELSKLLERVPIPVKESIEEPSAKVLKNIAFCLCFTFLLSLYFVQFFFMPIFSILSIFYPFLKVFLLLYLHQTLILKCHFFLFSFPSCLLYVHLINILLL